MRKSVRAAAVAAVLLAMSGAAQAQPASELEKKELALLVNSVTMAAERGDTSLIAGTMPERVYKEMAARMNTSEQALRQSLQRSVAAQFAHAGPHGYSMDSKAIRYLQAQDGTFYALVPTRVETDKSVAEFMTPAIYDNTKWHLIYGGQKTLQNPVFAEIYPYAANIVLPPAKITPKTAP